jgi:oligosaccharide repeat unit polymerase
LFFFALAPSIQLIQQTTFWGAQHALTVSDYTFGSILSLTSLLIYKFLYNSFYLNNFSKTKRKGQLNAQPTLIVPQVNFVLLLLISFSAAIILAYSKGFSMIALFYRDSMAEEFQYTISSTQRLIINNFIRPIPVIALIFFKLWGSSKSKFVEVLLFVLVLISNSPTGMPRFQAGAVYMALAIVYFPLLRKKQNFNFLFCLSFLIVFPFLNRFRYLTYSAKENYGFDLLNTPTFDTYQNTIQTINEGIITYGHQLVGVLFFFIPRSIWENKPIGSGALLAKNGEYFFDNIAMSFIGEGYINFGFLGIGLFITLLALLNAYCDKAFWNKEFKRFYTPIFYLVFLGLEFFILRGDLLSSFSYTIGFFLSIFLITKITIYSKKYRLTN